MNFGSQDNPAKRRCLFPSEVNVFSRSPFTSQTPVSSFSIREADVVEKSLAEGYDNSLYIYSSGFEISSNEVILNINENHEDQHYVYNQDSASTLSMHESFEPPLYAHGEFLSVTSTIPKKSINDYFGFRTRHNVSAFHLMQEDVLKEEPMNAGVLCVVCNIVIGDQILCLSCGYCTHSICQSTCAAECNSCRSWFCRFCVNTNYDRSEERLLCPDCI